MRFKKFGGVALAAVFLATAVPQAFAQQPPSMQVNKQMVGPMNEARAAIVAKDFAGAKTKLDQASGLVKTPTDRLALEQLRVSYAANAGDSAALIAAVDAMVATKLMTPADLKPYKAAVPEAYSKLGDTAKSLATSRAFLDEYGGTADQYHELARNYLAAKDTASAIANFNKAIDMAKAAGTKPPENYYTRLMLAHKTANDMGSYYATEERLAVEYQNDAYWRELIARVQNMPGYGYETRLDMFRTLQAAKVKLSKEEKNIAASEALKHGLPNEALQIIEPAIASGELAGNAEAEKYLKDAKQLSAEDKVNLAKDTPGILSKGTAVAIAKTGEAYLSYGDNAKAIELINAALAKGMTGEEGDIAKLHLGIAQFRSGQKDAAQTTWGGIKDGIPGVLAHNWVVISNLK
ncbi:MAG: hypothetical protein QM773_11505 [Hyphomonadaceae bacterium]